MTIHSKKIDYWLFFSVIALIFLGQLFLSILSASLSLTKFGNTNYFLLHQLLYGLLFGLVLGFIFFKMSLHFLQKIAPILFFLNLALLILVFLPQIGARFGGATRWLGLGDIIFQPSEFLKITSIIYLASWLQSREHSGLQKESVFKSPLFAHRKKESYGLKQVFFPFLFFLGVISIIFIYQPDISTLGIIFLTSLVMYFGARTPLWQNALIVLVASISFLGLATSEQYRLSRIITFLNPGSDPLGISFQMNQSSIAIGSGGILGQGLGMSSQKFGFVPQSMSDSVFAIFAEETGFIGSFVLISLFLLFLWRGLRVAKLAKDKFCCLAALGITFWIVFQGFINISSMAGLFPLTGIPLPFLSYGGSHLVAELIGVGILLNISKNS